MSVIVDVAEAVKDELNAHEFSIEFVAVRRYQPVFDLKDISDVVVSVVPRRKRTEPASRGAVQDTVEIDIAVQQKIQPGNNGLPDALMDLVEEISDFFKQRRLTEYPGAAWTGVENQPVFHPGHIRKLGQFTSVLTLAYEVVQ